MFVSFAVRCVCSGVSDVLITFSEESYRLWERERERESVCVCVCVCARELETSTLRRLGLLRHKQKRLILYLLTKFNYLTGLLTNKQTNKRTNKQKLTEWHNDYLLDAGSSLNIPQYRLYWLGIFVGFLSPSSQTPWHYLKICADCFLACTSQLFMHCHLISRRCIFCYLQLH